MNSHAQLILEFLKEIGIEYVQADLDDNTFLPGVSIEQGRLVIDFKRLKYPGDLLHEAGHLALLPERDRQQSNGDFSEDEGLEMGVLAWSYAASLRAGIPVDVLFHQDGYKGDSQWLIEHFTSGTYLGLPILEWKLLASSNGDLIYPEMLSWLCD